MRHEWAGLVWAQTPARFVAVLFFRPLRGRAEGGAGCVPTAEAVGYGSCTRYAGAGVRGVLSRVGHEA
jgi:hypothetical protein